MTSALETDISGRVVDDRGEPVEGMSIRLYGLLDNTQFVEGGDVRSGRAYIDREAILASNNTLGTAQTDADGRFRLTGFVRGTYRLRVDAPGHRSQALEGLAGGEERLRIALTALPDAIGRLTSLTLLYLRGNHHTALPAASGGLTSLT